MRHMAMTCKWVFFSSCHFVVQMGQYPQNSIITLLAVIPGESFRLRVFMALSPAFLY